MFRNLPKHIIRLLVLLGLFLLTALTAKTYFTDPSFYKFGHYRADVVPALATGVPLFRGTAYCQTCHDEKQYDTSAGAHQSVECEVCHGTHREHPDNGKMQIPTDTVRLCSTCHEAMPARPVRQPQIVLQEHPSPGEVTSQCQTCHNPHSPEDENPVEILAAASIDLTGLVSKCVKCHGKQGEGRRKNPALAGMESVVFIEQMNKYKSDSSISKKMTKYATPLSEEEIVELARYYENLPAAPPEKLPE